jgi:repressor LexA
MVSLSRKQQDIYEFLLTNQDKLAYPPTLNELRLMLGLASRGSLHKHVKALIEAGLVKPMNRKV